MRYILILLGFLYSFENYAQNFDTFFVHFDIGSFEIQKEYESQLFASLQALNTSPRNKILIYGYSDYLGDAPPNITLSENRASAVKKWYLKNNVADSRFLIVAGLGQQQKQKSSSDERGDFENRKSMILVSNRSDMRTYSDSATFKLRSLTIKQEISATQIGETIILKNIFFKIHTDDLMPESKATLTELLSTMRDNVKLKISIEGHICCNALEGSNPNSAAYKLSIFRAKKIHEYLLLNGISSDRVEYKGFGRMKPLYPDENTEEEMAANRRVEIRILSK
jgi:outer membrane protein OmpA-like peptidoglycan-associated protein